MDFDFMDLRTADGLIDWKAAPIVEITPSLCSATISAASPNLFNDSHAAQFIHLAFSTDGYHVLNGGMSGSIDRSRMFTIITLCA